MDVARRNCLLLDMRNSKTHIRSSQTWSRIKFPRAACLVFLRFFYKSLSGLWIEICRKKNPTISWSVCVLFRLRSWGITPPPNPIMCVWMLCMCLYTCMLYVSISIHCMNPHVHSCVVCTFVYVCMCHMYACYTCVTCMCCCTCMFMCAYA